MMKSVEYAAKNIKETSSTTWLNDWCKAFLFKHLKQLKVGQLTIRESDDVCVFGEDNESDYVVEIIVTNREAYKRILFGGTIGSGESYMLGHWWSSDITGVVKLMLANKSYLKNMETPLSFAKKMVGSVLDFTRLNSLAGSKRNIVAHYDLSNEFFGLFLDESMMYSSAIYPDKESDLGDAAEYKLKHVCERLQLKASDHVIEIGSGWGGMAIYAAKHYGCNVTTTTISDEQYAYAEQRIKEEGLEDKITLLNQDYRLLEGRYDKLISIEMIEAVGHRFYKQFFKKCNSLLKDNGMGLIQAITTSDHRFEKEKNKIDFIRRYIFPGGCLPSNNVIAQMLARYTNMQCVGYEDITLHYAKTLQHWRESFMARLPEVKSQGFDDVFCRMWEFYLAYCEGGFSEREVHTGQFVFAKPLAKTLPPLV